MLCNQNKPPKGTSNPSPDDYPVELDGQCARPRRRRVQMREGDDSAARASSGRFGDLQAPHALEGIQRSTQFSHTAAQWQGAHGQPEGGKRGGGGVASNKNFPT